MPHRQSYRLLLILALAGWPRPQALAHDIPNERIDRSIQVSLSPGQIAIDYEVSLTELTLTQDLRRLIGSASGADREEWLARYGRVTGPLNAKGVLVTAGGKPVVLLNSGYDLVVEDHPRYTFHFTGQLPQAGRLRVRDMNYLSSEGTSRLAIRGSSGVLISGDQLPADVTQIAIRPVWSLSDLEERRTKQVDVEFGPASPASVSPAIVAPSVGFEPRSEGDVRTTKGPAVNAKRGKSHWGLSGLLDETSRASWLALAAVAILLGAAHAIQPGHGKTLVTAIAIGPEVRIYQPALLGLTVTLTHVGSVLLFAAALWYTGATRVATVHQVLAKLAGFIIGAVGLWRVGRAIGAYPEHEHVALDATAINDRGLISLGIAGGIVPCWDAIALLILAAAVGRLAAGIALVLAYSAGMATVLVVLGSVAWKLKAAALGGWSDRPWRRPLAIVGSSAIAIAGVWLFLL